MASYSGGVKAGGTIKKTFFFCVFFLLSALLLCSPGKAEREADLGRGLVLHFTFGEDFGEVAWDSSGEGNWGRFRGEARRSEGEWGKALELEGQISYVEVPGSESLARIEDGITYSAWVRPAETHTGTIVQSRSHLNRLILVGSEIWGSFGFGRVRHNVRLEGIDYERKLLHLAVSYDGESVVLYAGGEEVSRL